MISLAPSSLLSRRDRQVRVARSCSAMRLRRIVAFGATSRTALGAPGLAFWVSRQQRLFNRRYHVHIAQVIVLLHLHPLWKAARSQDDTRVGRRDGRPHGPDGLDRAVRPRDAGPL